MPTSVVPKNLSEIEQKVYELVVKRFLSAFALNHEYTSSIIAALCEEKYLFVSRGKMTKTLGWKQVLNEAEEDDKEDKKEDDQKLPILSLGDKVKINKLNLKEDKTKAPPRYNDSSLLSAMQNPGSKTDDKEEKEQLKSCGLGTPATRAAIIKNLETKEYIKRDKKNLIPTEKAFELFKMLQKYKQNFLYNPIMTAEWEKTLQAIEKNPNHAMTFLENLNKLTNNIVSNIKSAI